MRPRLPPGTTHAVHPRAPSVTGGKDWVGSVTDRGELHTRWGRTGHLNQALVKPGSLADLTRWVGQKLRRGYTRIDAYDAERGWESEPCLDRAAASLSPASHFVAHPGATLCWDF